LGFRNGVAARFNDPDSKGRTARFNDPATVETPAKLARRRLVRFNDPDWSNRPIAPGYGVGTFRTA
jgi:hypothetical protein